ncbi:MAG: hypothetical protein WD355_00785 [Balneolaceae bacterium]
MKNVLIVTQHFPPINNVAARRFGWMSAYFEDFGWRPYVLTTVSEGPLSVPIPEEHCIRLFRHPHRNKKMNSSKSMSAARNRYSSISSLVPNNIRLRSFDNTVLNWYLPILNELDWIIDKFPKPDLVIGSYSPSASLLLARKISIKTNTPWIADFRDLGALRNLSSNTLLKWIDSKVEKCILSRASGITTVSNNLNKLLSEKYQISTRTIYNGYNSCYKHNSNETYLKQNYNNYIHYAGTIYSHQLPSIKLLFEVLSEYPDINLMFRSLGPDSLNEEVIKFANQFNIANQFTLLPPVEPDLIEEEQDAAILNLVFEELDKSSTWGAGTLTGKFLKLLPVNKPILSICRPDNEMADILAYTDKGRVCSTKDEIIDFLTFIREHPSSFSGIMKNINDYSTRMQALKLCDFMTELSNHSE